MHWCRWWCGRVGWEGGGQDRDVAQYRKPRLLGHAAACHPAAIRQHDGPQPPLSILSCSERRCRWQAEETCRTYGRRPGACAIIGSQALHAARKCGRPRLRIGSKMLQNFALSDRCPHHVASRVAHILRLPNCQRLLGFTAMRLPLARHATALSDKYSYTAQLRTRMRTSTTFVVCADSKGS